MNPKNGLLVRKKWIDVLEARDYVDYISEEEVLGEESVEITPMPREEDISDPYPKKRQSRTGIDQIVK